MGFRMNLLHTEGQTVPDICLRLRGKTSKVQKNPLGGLLGPRAAEEIFLCQVLTPPPSVKT